MVNHIRLACDPKILLLPLSSILPVRKISVGMTKTEKCRRIAASIREVGVVEPLVVYPQANDGTQYILLDGHIRLAILKEMGQEKVRCLVAADNEGFTYNHKVNPLSAIQEHFMIMEAIRQGVSEERIAKALSVDVAAIRRKRDLLDGICPEAVQLLKEKRASAGAFREMRKVKPMRQIEMAELMVAANNFSASYAQCLLAATPQDQLLEPDKPKEVNGLLRQLVYEIETVGACCAARSVQQTIATRQIKQFLPGSIECGMDSGR
jgi:ParB-like chromosome segregation protein Spo0J